MAMAILGGLWLLLAGVAQGSVRALAFEDARGSAMGVDALVRGPGYLLWLRDGAATMRLLRAAGDPRTASTDGVVLRWRFPGAAAHPALAMLDPQPAHSHYLSVDGSRPARHARHHARVRYSALWPGVDLVYYGTDDGQLEYDFVVAPGADPTQIRLVIDGADALALADNGDLQIATAVGALRQHAPRLYQYDAAGARRPVRGAWQLADGQLSFAVGAYDRSRPLVIDPVLVWSSFLGGNGDDQVFDLAQRNGEVYVTGRTLSTNFPTTAGVLQAADQADVDCFVSKFAADGATLVWSTYLGNTGIQYCNGIAVDSGGNSYVAAFTDQFAAAGSAFVAKLNSTGSALVYAPAFGGNGRDEAVAIAVNGAGEAFVAGYTDSTDFPTSPGAAQTSDPPGRDAFGMKFDAAGALVFRSYAGLAGDDIGYAVGYTANGRLVLGGQTKVNDAAGDGLIVRFNTAGSSFEAFEPAVHGNGAEAIHDLEVDGGTGRVLVTGYTESSDLPTTAGVLQPAYGGDRDAFVAQLLVPNGAPSSFDVLTYLGGRSAQTGNALGRDAAGNLYVAGRSDALDAQGNVFVLKLGPQATSLHYNLNFGGAGALDNAQAIAVDASGNAWVAGSTAASDFPTTAGAFDTAKGAGLDGFVMKIGPDLPTTTLVSNVTIAGSAFGASGAVTSPSVTLQPGDLVTVEAVSGTVNFNTLASDTICIPAAYSNGPEGRPRSDLTDQGNACYDGERIDCQVNSNDPFPALPHAGLMRPAQSGIGGAAFIGGGSETFTYAGTANTALRLGVNDVSCPFSPNAGQFNVRVTIVRSTAFNVTVPGTNVGSSAGLTQPQVTLQPGDQVNVQAAGGTVQFNDGPCTPPTYQVGPAGTVLDLLNACYADDGTCGSPSGNPVPGQNHAGLIRGQMTGIGGPAFIGNGNLQFSHAGSSPVNLRLGVNDLSCANSPNTGSFQASVSITRPVPVLSLSTPSVVEGNAGTTQMVYTVTLSPASSQTVTATAQTADATAIAGSDYVALSQALSFAPGQTSQTVSVTVNGDTQVEADETLLLFLVNPKNASTVVPARTGTILSDDLPALAVNDVSVTEGDSGSTPASFTVSLSPAAPFPVTVTARTVDGSALAGSDYTSVQVPLTFSAGQTSQSVPVSVLGDNLPETNEGFQLQLSGASAATVADGTGQGTILNDDAYGTLSIGAGFTIGENDPVPPTLTVQRSGGDDGTVTVQWQIANGSAVLGQDWNAPATGGTLTFLDGETSKTLSFSLIDDALDEDDETVLVSLSNVGGGAALGNSSATVTIIDNDPVPTLSVDGGGCSVSEGNSGSTNCSFVARLSAVSGRNVNFSSATANGTALAGSDYSGHGSTARSVVAGQQTLAIDVPVTGDTLDEANETFSLNLTGISNATPGTLSATGTIVDDDSGGTLAFAQTGYTVDEFAGTVTISVNRSGGAASGVSVQYATANGTASAPGDYSSTSGTLNFGAGVASQSFTVTINNDALDEANEIFTITLSNPQGGAVLGSPATTTVTIVDEDATPTLAIDNGGCSVVEPDPPVTTGCTFTFRLSAASGRDVSFSTQTANGTATAGSDYNAQGATARTIVAGQTTLAVPVIVLGDLLDEADESFQLQASAVVNASPGTLSATGTIVDNDGAPTLSIDNGGCTVAEGNSASVPCNFVVRLSSASAQPVSFTAATADGTATGGTDYTAVAPTPFNLAAGQTTIILPVSVLGDALYEASENFQLQLSAVSNATPTSLTGTGTITNDDAAPTLSVDGGGCNVTEGNSGTTPCTFVFRLSAVSGLPVSFNASTQDGSAASPADYLALASTPYTIPAGQLTLNIPVSVVGDTVVESSESFQLQAAGVSQASPPSLGALGGILDDDGTGTGSLQILGGCGQRFGEQSGNQVIAVERTGDLTGAAQLNYQFAGISATPGADYQALDGTLTWSSGTGGVREIPFQLLADGVDEPLEEFRVTASAAGGAPLSGRNDVTVGILDARLFAQGLEEVGCSPP